MVGLCFRFSFHSPDGNVKLEAFVGEGTRPKSLKWRTQDLNLPDWPAHPFCAVLCVTLTVPFRKEGGTEPVKGVWGREMWPHSDLFSGPAPWQPQQRLSGPLSTLRLPGPAGGDAGRQQLQGSGPEGVGSFCFGPEDPVGRGRNHGRCRSRGAPGAPQGPPALLEAPA